MVNRRDKPLGDLPKSQTASAYTLSDPTLRAYDHGIGTLRVEGEVKGYLASVVGEIRSRRPHEPWPWFVVIWADGTKENSFEDYGPMWSTVRELDSGWFEHYEQGATKERRFLEMLLRTTTRGLPCKYDFAWLPSDEAAEKWKDLGLDDADF